MPVMRNHNAAQSYVNRENVRRLSTQPLDVSVSVITAKVEHSCDSHHLGSPPGKKLRDPSTWGVLSRRSTSLETGVEGMMAFNAEL